MGKNAEGALPLGLKIIGQRMGEVKSIPIPIAIPIAK